MYLTYDKYVSMGGKLGAEDFTKAQGEVEGLLNLWTLNRLKSPRVLADLEAQGLSDTVPQAAMAIFDRLDAIKKARESKANGEVVTSFNNGVNSFSFAAQNSDNDALQEAYARVCEILPVDVISACVCFNEAM